MCAPENSDDFDDIFPPEFVAQQQERFSREPKTKVDPASPLYAAAKQNEQLGQNPKDHPAFAAFRGVRPDYETPALLDNLTICQNDCGFEGDQAWLAAAFLTYTGLPTSKLTGDGKIARDARAKWRREMEVYLKDDPLIKVLSYYHYAVTEMHEDGLSIHDPGSISNRVADIIARSNRANGGKEYVPRQRNV